MSLADKPGFISTPCGWIPNSWVATKLSTLVDIVYGKSPADIEKLDHGIPIFGTGGVSGYTNASLCDGPSIILGRKGTIDKVQRSEGPFWAIDTTFYTRPKQAFDWSWLYYAISSFDLRKLNEASGVPSLSRASLEVLDIATPNSRTTKNRRHPHGSGRQVGRDYPADCHHPKPQKRSDSKPA